MGGASTTLATPASSAHAGPSIEPIGGRDGQRKPYAGPRIFEDDHRPDCDFLDGELCIEVLSRDDTLKELQSRVNDYSAMGFAHIWAVDPIQRVGYIASPRGFVQPKDGTLHILNTPILIKLADVFAEVDEM